MEQRNGGGGGGGGNNTNNGARLGGWVLMENYKAGVEGGRWP